MPDLSKLQASVSSLVTEGIAVNSGYNCRVQRVGDEITARVCPSLAALGYLHVAT